MEVLSRPTLKRRRSEIEDNICDAFSKLDNIIISLSEKIENKTSYNDFEFLDDAEDVVEDIWEYINIFNNMKIDSNHSSDIKDYWLYIREFVPLVLQFPGHFASFSDEDFTDALETVIYRNVFNLADSYQECMSSLYLWNEEKVYPASNFVENHRVLGVSINDDIDKNIFRIFNLYNQAMESMFNNYTETSHENIERGLLIDM